MRPQVHFTCNEREFGVGVGGGVVQKIVDAFFQVGEGVCALVAADRVKGS